MFQLLDLRWRSFLTFVIVRALAFFIFMFSPKLGSLEHWSFWYQKHFLEAFWNIALSQCSTRLHRKAHATSLSAWNSTMLLEFTRSFSPYEKVKYEDNRSWRWQLETKLNRMITKRKILTISLYISNTYKYLVSAYVRCAHWMRSLLHYHF